jgi:hypothetical protein
LQDTAVLGVTGPFAEKRFTALPTNRPLPLMSSLPSSVEAGGKKAAVDGD